MQLCQKSIDVWVSAETPENLEDLAVRALFQGTPVLVPRTSSAKELIHYWGEVGLTYKGGDSRDLRDQLGLLVEKTKRYTRQIGKISDEIIKKNLIDYYRDHLSTTYRKIFAARRRVSKRKTPKNPSQTA